MMPYSLRSPTVTFESNSESLNGKAGTDFAFDESELHEQLAIMRAKKNKPKNSNEATFGTEMVVYGQNTVEQKLREHQNIIMQQTIDAKNFVTACLKREERFESQVKELAQELAGVTKERDELQTKLKHALRDINTLEKTCSVNLEKYEEAMQQKRKLEGRLDSIRTNTLHTVVVVLDFEKDLFASKYFQRNKKGKTGAQAACNALVRLIEDNLSSEMEESIDRTLIFIYYNRTDQFIENLIGEDIIESEEDVNQFIKEFSLVDPMFVVLSSDNMPEAFANKRLMSRANLANQDPYCELLILGKWACQTDFLSHVSAPGPRESGKSLLPEKIKILEPLEKPKKKIKETGVKYHFIPGNGVFRKSPLASYLKDESE